MKPRKRYASASLRQKITAQSPETSKVPGTPAESMHLLLHPFQTFSFHHPNTPYSPSGKRCSPGAPRRRRFFLTHITNRQLPGLEALDKVPYMLLMIVGVRLLQGNCFHPGSGSIAFRN